MKHIEEADLGELVTRAQDIAEKVTSDTDWHPVVIEFAGSPKSGKSTNIDILDHFFKRTGFKVFAPTEGVSKRTPYHLRRDLMAYNSWALCYAISELLIGYYSVDKNHIVILDRGPFDSLGWMNILKKRGELSKEDYTTVLGFVTLDKWKNLVERIYLFTCDPKVSLKRELEAKLIRFPGFVMNEEMLHDLKDQYGVLKNELQSEQKIYPVDTTNTESPIDTAYPIAKDILNIMESTISE
jgi:hypothetical protein